MCSSVEPCSCKPRTTSLGSHTRQIEVLSLILIDQSRYNDSGPIFYSVRVLAVCIRFATNLTLGSHRSWC